MASSKKLVEIVLQMKDQYSRQMQEAADKTEGLSRRMTKVGGMLSATVTPAMIGLGAASIQTAIDLESSFAGVIKTIDGTPQQIQEVRKELDRLATSGESPVSALENAQEQLYEMAEAAGQLGVAREDVTEFVDVMGQLAMSTDIVGEEGARQLAQFANVAQFDLKNIRNLGDVIVDLGNNMATTESQILTFGQRMGNLSQIGFQAEEILAYGSAMASAGLTAELGSTNFVRGATNMAIAAAQGGESLESIASTAGMTADAFKSLFDEDSAGAMQQFLIGLSDLPLEEQVVALGAIGVTGVEAQRVFLTLAGNTDMVAEAMDLAGEAIQGNGALLEEASRRAETTQGEMNKLGNNMRALRDVIGSELLPIVNSFIDVLVPMIQAFTNAPEPVQKTLVGILAFSAALGPILMLVGNVTTAFGLLSGAFGGLAITIPSATAVMGGFSAALGVVKLGLSGLLVALGPIGLLIAGIVVVTGLLIANWGKLTTTFGQVIAIMKHGLQQAINGTKSALQSAGASISSFTQSSGNKLQEWARNAGASMQEFKKNTVEAMRDAPKSMGKFMGSLNEFGNKVAESFKRIGSVMLTIGRAIIMGLIRGIREKINEFFSLVREMGEGAIQRIRSVFDIRSPSHVTEEMGNQVALGFQNGLESEMDLQPVIDRIIREPFSDVNQIVSEEMANAGMVMQASFDQMTSLQQAYASAVASNARTAASTLRRSSGLQSGRTRFVGLSAPKGSNVFGHRGGPMLRRTDGGSGNPLAINIGNINTTRGTTREQTEEIIDELGRRIQRKGGLGIG